MSNKKRKAFTLTELLVVVVIIGVLSAVVLPKFTKVLETRKTTEAEAMMAAVRNEQEARCSISKNYTADLSKLASLNKQSDTKNYKYEDFEGVGVQASAKGSYAYNLRMPSYVDGRICCDGKDCEKLNKDYPTCDELQAKGDYVPGNTECEAEPLACNGDHQEGEEASNTACECGGPRIEQWTCQGTTWIKEVMQDCRPAEECKEYCESGKPGWEKWEDIALRCEHSQNGTGTWNTQTCKCDCSAGEYNESTGECEQSCAPGKPGWEKWRDIADRCEDSQHGVGSWNTQTCKCDCIEGEYDEDSAECVAFCAPGKPGWDDKWADIADRCEHDNGKWDTSSCSCKCPGVTKWSVQLGACVSCDIYDTATQIRMQSCEQPQSVEGFYPKAGKWDNETCTCDCPVGSALDPNLEICTPFCGSEYDQDRDACKRGANDPKLGDNFPGYFDENTCECKCATRYGVKYDSSSRACYRPNCTTRTNTHLDERTLQMHCELSDKRYGTNASMYVRCSNGTYRVSGPYKCPGSLVKGRWVAEHCWCDCPRGSYFNGLQCKVSGATWQGRDTDQDNDYGIADDWPDNDSDVPEDDDYMGTGVGTGSGSDYDDMYEEYMSEGGDYSWYDVGVSEGNEFNGGYEFEITHHQGDDDDTGGYGDDRDNPDWDGW